MLAVWWRQIDFKPCLYLSALSKYIVTSVIEDSSTSNLYDKPEKVHVYVYGPFTYTKCFMDFMTFLNFKYGNYIVCTCDELIL